MLVHFGEVFIHPDAVGAGLARDPEDRFHSAREFGRALGRS
jgi:hypothetical protein